MVNTPTEHIRFRYLHMRPQVPTRVGWVFVSLVAAYEHLIGGRGAEISDEMVASVAPPAPPTSPTRSRSVRSAARSSRRTS